ncbi:LysR family transcriptional regulator [Caballeronia peredens]|nr:LysR family transcriptional regulator [Caballeronia peredens]
MGMLLAKPRLQVATPDAAVEAAIRGLSFAYLLDYHVARAVEASELSIVLSEFEVEAIPVHLMHVSRGQLPIKLRRFIDYAVPRFRESLAALSRYP